MVIVKWIPFGAQQSAANPSSKPAPLPAISSADAKKFGFENFGNTCYANSVLQALYFCAPFRDLILQYPDPSVLQNVVVPPPATPIPAVATPSPQAQARPKPQRKLSIAGANGETTHMNGSPPTLYPPIPSSPPTLFSALRSLFLFISKHPEDKGVVPPRAFIDKLKEVNELFRSSMHQDAHEFLNYLLNKIVEEIEDEKQHQQVSSQPTEDLSGSLPTLPSRVTTASTTSLSPSNLVHRLFEGTLTSETRCLTCETVSSRDESFLDLSIDIERNSSVTACLRQFSASEMLCHRNKFFCDSCCDLQEAEKRMKIKKLPNILALHLKRFKYQDDLQKYIKLAYRVAFPFELRLFNTVDDTDDADRLYELFAIVVHIGNGPHHGHYISLIKTLGSWLAFDDDVVEPLKESDIPKYFGDSNSGSAYVLYYQAVDIDLVALGLRPPVPEPPEPPQEPATDPRASPLQPIPPSLPGLSDETGSSEINDPAFPVTPSQNVLPIPEKSPLRALNKASVFPKVNVSHPDELSPSSTVTPASATSTSSIGGLFNSLRRGPSAKAKATGSSSWLESRKSYSELSPQVPAIPPLPTPDDKSKMVSSPPPPQPPQNTNDKPKKEPDKKASTWFKRKGVKMRPETGSEHTPSVSTNVDEDAGSQPSMPPPPSWYRTPGHTPMNSTDDRNRRPSEPILVGPRAAPSLTAPAPQVSSSISADGHRDRRNGYDSPSADSATSSLGSTHAAHHPLKNIDFPRFSSSSTNLHTFGTQQPLPPSTPHKRSVSQRHPTHYTPAPSPPPRVPPRPASAFDNVKGSTGRSSRFVQPPPVPSIPSPTLRSPATNGKTPDRREHESDTFRGRGREPGRIMRHNTFHPGTGPARSHDAVDGNSLSTGDSTGSSNLKRVSRKLSLTNPILAFGRKDKDRDNKPRESDRRVQLPPSSYPGMVPRI